MIPYSDGIAPRRFPVVNVALIVANFAVFLFYELPNGEAAVNQASFYPCDCQRLLPPGRPVGGRLDHGHVHACRLGPHPGQHAVPGDLRQERRGRIRAAGYLLFYFAGGFAAMMLQTAMTLLFGTAADAQIPNLGASGAIAAVLGAYFVLYPSSRIRTLLLWFPVNIPAWIFLGRLVPVPVLREQLRADPPLATPVTVASRSSPMSVDSSSVQWWPEFSSAPGESPPRRCDGQNAGADDVAEHAHRIR